MIAFFLLVSLVGCIAIKTARWVNTRQAPAPPRRSGPPPRQNGGGRPAPSVDGRWTALDEIQLIRLLTDSASS